MVLTTIDARLMGRQLLGTCLLSHLKTGTTLAQTQSLGNTPVLIDLLNKQQSDDSFTSALDLK